jgi:SSS family transporter
VSFLQVIKFFYVNKKSNKYFILFFLLFIVSTYVNADSLVSTSMNKIVSLPSNENVLRIWNDNEQLIALTDKSIWLLDENNEEWQRKSESLMIDEPVISVVNDGLHTFLLLKSSSLDHGAKVESFTLLAKDSLSTILPSLPVNLMSGQVSLLDGLLYVLGLDQENTLQFLSIDPYIEKSQWVSHAAWDGNVDKITSFTSQNSSLLATISEQNGANDRMINWSVKNGWTERSALSGHVIDGTARAIGQGHVLYIVDTFKGGEEKLRLMTFHTITGSWATIDTLESSSAVLGVGWKKGIVWLEPKDNSNSFFLIQIESGKQLLSNIDWAVLLVYLFGMLGIGLYFYKKQGHDSEVDFFLGGRSIPFWAAGISLYASNASSISYIAVPAKAFSTNWQYLLSSIIVVFGLIFVAIWVVPLLRRLNLMSIFQYLETRFHPSIRVISSLLFIVFQLGGRMTIILFLPSLAISTVTGIDIVWCILVMGFVTIGYTVLGGMKAVIWTDVLQLFVMFGGTVFAFIFIIMSIDGGFSEFLAISSADDKMKMIDWSFNLTDATIWGFIFLVFFDTVLTFPKDQVLMQRVLSTPSAKDASRSMWTFALILIPASTMFYLIGTALYTFYQTHPERMDPLLSIDATFPLFIAAELPVGIAGLIIAGIFAAAMSTLSSILNSVATVASVDFYDKYYKSNKDKKNNIRFAELITVISGLIGICLAMLLSLYDINSLLDVALELWGLLGGGFAGAYTLGMFTRRANWQGVVIGVIASLSATIFAWTISLVHPYFYLPFAVLICIVVGYAASWFFPAPTQLEGLTIFDDELENIQVKHT